MRKDGGHIFSAVEKVTDYIRGLNSSIWEDMLEQQRRMLSMVCCALRDTKRTTTVNERSQRASMKLAHPQQSIGSKMNMEREPKFRIANTPDSPSTGSIFPEKQSPRPHQHPLNTEKVFVLRPELVI